MHVITDIWSYFTTDTTTGCAVCIDCNLQFKRTNNVGTEMSLHLQQCHPENFNKIQQNENSFKKVEKHDNENDTEQQRPLNEIESTLIEAIARFWKDETFSDVQIYCENRSTSIKTHSLILGALSPLIREVIETVPRLDNEDVIIILPDANHDLMINFLDKIYYGSNEEFFISPELQFLGIGFDGPSTKRPEEVSEKIEDGNILRDRYKGIIYNSKNRKNEQILKSTCNTELPHLKYFVNVDNKSTNSEDCWECSLCRDVFLNLNRTSSELLQHFTKNHRDILKKQPEKSLKRKRISTSTKKETLRKVVKLQVLHTASSNQYLPSAEDKALEKSLDKGCLVDNKSQDSSETESKVTKRRKLSAKKIRNSKETQLVMFSKQKGPRVGTPSIAWNFFEMINSNAAKCLVCEVLVATTFSSTSGLLKHLKIKHMTYCEKWENENIQNFNHSILDSSESHPIRQHFKEMERDTWSCCYCDTVFLGIESCDIKSLDDHLKEYHCESFKDYELEKVAILCRKGKENKMQLSNLKNEEQSKAGKLNQEDETLISKKPTKYLTTGLSNILASDFFETLDKDMLQCTLCLGTVRLKTPLNSSCDNNLSVNLWKHLKLSHLDIYEQLKIEQNCISNYIKFHYVGNPIWKHFKKSKPSEVNCLECDTVMSIDSSQGHLLQDHLSSIHYQKYLEFEKNDTKMHEKLEELVQKYSPGLPRLFKSLFKEVQGDSTFECKECEERTTVQSELEMANHVVRHHEQLLATKLKLDSVNINEQDGIEINASLGECFCTKCNPVSLFASTTALESHDRYKHLGERPYPCDQCSRTFIRSDELKLHRRYHEDRETKKGAMCSQCGMVFNSSASRIRHENTVHHNIRRHACRCCGKKFASSQALERHSRIHSDVKPHQCTECGQQFREVAHLKVHYRTHSGEKPISCPNCSLRFKHYAGRRSHKCEGIL